MSGLTESSPLLELAREHIAYIDPKEFALYIGRCKCGWQGRRRATRDDAADDCAAHLIGIGVELAASPVVDEAKIAEVLAQHVLSEPNGGTASLSWCDCSCGHQERVHGGTRDRALYLARQHQARAVVEALGGGR